MTATYLTSRGRIESTQKCPRLRYLEKDFEGRGLETTKLSLPLATGSAVHKGVEVLLKIEALGLPVGTIQLELPGGFEFRIDNTTQPIDMAVQAAIAEFKQAYETHEVDATVNESMQFIQDEHCALIELVLRLWAEHPDGLPWLLREYEVLEVEQWDLMPLVGGEQCLCGGYPQTDIAADVEPYPPSSDCVVCGGTGVMGGITLRSRADALLRKRSDGSLYVWSLKTANGWDKRQENANRHDVQGISEMVAVETRLRVQQAQGEWTYQKTFGSGPTPRVEGTQMTYLIKGRRKLNEKLNVYQIDSGLLHPWAIDAGLLGEKEYAHSYWYNCELPHQKGTTKAGKPIMCEGNARHRLSDTWQSVNIWEHMTIKEWVRMLLDGQVQPSLPLPTTVINPIPYFRNDVEVQDWLEQVVEQEAETLKGIRMVEVVREHSAYPMSLRSVLNKYFPQHRRSCFYPSPCAFNDICWGPSAVADDPVGSGLYKLRTPIDHEEANGSLETD